ncbi:MAG: hypothetical protein ACLFNN_00875 [Candidatus Paceibacterota bacterium]
MDILWISLVAMVLILVIVVLVLATISVMAKEDWFFTQITQGKIKFINRGDAKEAVWPNVGGYGMSIKEDPNGRHWLIPIEDEDTLMNSFFYPTKPGTLKFKLDQLLWDKLKIRFISILWFQVYVHKFEVERLRLKGATKKKLDIAETNIKGKNTEGLEGKSTEDLQNRIQESPNESLVDSLLFLIPRPILVTGVELGGDGTRISILCHPVYQVVIPTVPIYYYRAKFFTLLDSAFSAALTNFFADHRVAVYTKKGAEDLKAEEGELAHEVYDPKLGDEFGNKNDDYKKYYSASKISYWHWLKMKKTEGSAIKRHLWHLNATKSYYEELVKHALRDKEYNNENVNEHPHVKFLNKLTHNLFLDNTTISSKDLGSGIIPQFGLALTDPIIEDYAPYDQATKDLSASMPARQTNFWIAEGVREKAYGTRDAMVAQGTGEADRFKNLVNSLIKQGTDPNIAAQVVETMLRTENIRDGQVSTYVEGGSRSSVMVPAGEQPKKQEGGGTET